MFFKLLSPRTLMTAALAVAGWSPALAYTECAHTVATIYRGDNGFMQILFNGTPNAYLSMTTANSDFKDILAMANIALITGKTVVLRYAANGVTCGSSAEQNRSDLVGMTIYQ